MEIAKQPSLCKPTIHVFFDGTLLQGCEHCESPCLVPFMTCADCACSHYGDCDDENGGGSQGQPFTPRGRPEGPNGRSRVQFARPSSRGVGASRRGGQASKSSSDKEDPKDYMSKAKQLWNYVGKVRPNLTLQNLTRQTCYPAMNNPEPWFRFIQSVSYSTVSS